MSKKLILLLAILLAVLAVAYFVKNNTSMPHSTSIHADSALVYKMFLADMQGNTITIKRNADGLWRDSDQKEVNQELPQHLLYVLQEAKPTQVVNAALRGTILKGLSTEGTKVEVYSKDGKMMRSFTIGGDTHEGVRGTYALTSESPDPCIYDILTYDGNFAIPIKADPAIWKSQKVISIAADSILQVDVAFNNVPDSGFSLKRNSVKAFELYTNSGKNLGAPDQKRLQQYLNFFGDVRCLGYENQNVRAQEIINTELRYAQLTITTNNKVKKEMVFMYVRADQRADVTKTFNGVDYNPEFLYAFDGTDLSLTNLDYISRVLCMRSALQQ
jgi:hypothetical protein